MKAFLSTVALVAVMCVATPGVVLAQAQYPPPVPTPTPTPTDDGGNSETCFRVDGDVDGRYVRGRVDHGSDIIVAGSAGTADANGQIDLFIDGRTRLGESEALQDGSFAYTLNLPDWVEPGHHRITGAIEGCGETNVDLAVLGTSLGAGGDGNSGSGDLPRTGLSILSHILRALLLVGIGALLLAVRTRPRARAVSSDVGVARLDTSDFVPRTSGQRRRRSTPHIPASSPEAASTIAKVTPDGSPETAKVSQFRSKVSMTATASSTERGGEL